jgi:streptomycin 6-kinase
LIVWEDVEETFRSSVTRIVGEDEARPWLAELPALEAEMCRRWQLEPGRELRGGLFALVRLVRRTDGSDAVLKLAGPWDRPADEIASLRAWRGDAAPRLLEADPARGALLLERITPGEQAVDASAEAVASLLERLHVAPPPTLPPLDEIVHRRIDRAAREGRATPQRVAWANGALERLQAEAPEPVLVHGDFDDRNLLTCDRRGLCAIDPLASAGDGAYDAAYWIHANRRSGRRARFDSIAAATRHDRGRLRDWCGIIAVHG